jgi:hypothetical protein
VSERKPGNFVEYKAEAKFTVFGWALMLCLPRTRRIYHDCGKIRESQINLLTKGSGILLFYIKLNPY